MKLSTAFELGIATAAGASIVKEILNPHMSPFEKGLALAAFAICTTLAAVTSYKGSKSVRENKAVRSLIFSNERYSLKGLSETRQSTMNIGGDENDGPRSDE